MKKTTIISLSSICFFISLAAEANNTRDGLYLGAGVGWSANDFDLNTNYASTGITTLNNANASQVLGDIFIGYGYTTASSLFWGAELGTYFPSRSITVGSHPSLSYPGLNVSDTLKIQDYVTLDLLPGYAISQNMLVYGRAGLVYGSLQLNQPSVAGISGLNMNDNTWGGRFGVGVNLAVSNTFGIGIDYFYTTYKNMSVYAAPFNANYTAKPSSNFVGLSILYAV